MAIRSNIDPISRRAFMRRPNRLRMDGHFIITDNGVGIEPQYHQRIFEPFERLHGCEIPGTGLDLAICRRIVERCGGKIWVESEPCKGASFHFMLHGEDCVT